MVDSPQNKWTLMKWFNKLIAPGELEAPDPNYRGHRDILTRSIARCYFSQTHIHGRVLEIDCG